MAEPKLYVIATPLGNLGDITLRALELCKELPHFFAEDTREFSKLLTLCGVPASERKLHSYSSHNMEQATDLAIQLLESGSSVGLVTDRGTPGISDPGALLVSRAREQGIAVVPVPGASSITAALSVSGLNQTEFTFVGFLPRKEKEQQDLWKTLKSLEWPIVFLESPKRIRESVQNLKKTFPTGKLFLAREMTKLYESLTWSELATIDPDTLEDRGEFVGVLVLAEEREPDSLRWMEEVQERIQSDKAWAKAVALRAGVAASEVYNALQQLKRERL